MQVEIGTTMNGKVSGIAPFGAFVEIEGGKSGLVHISEIALEYVDDVSKHLKVGQEVKVKVLAVNPNGKISLSIKKTLMDEENAGKSQSKSRHQKNSNKAPEEFDFYSKKRRENLSMSFEDKLLKFKQDSDEKIQDLKRNTEGKRSGGYRRAY